MLEGITNKLEKNAEILTVLVTAYAHEQEFGGGIGGLFTYLTKTGPGGALAELQYDLNNPQWFFDKLMGKTTPPHLYSAAFKLGAGLWLLGELGIYTKYKALGKKIATGGAIAAAIMQGSGPGAGLKGFNGSTGDTAGGYYKAPEGYQGKSNMGTGIKGF